MPRKNAPAPRKRGNPNWIKGGASPNPTGKSKAAVAALAVTAAALAGAVGLPPSSAVEMVKPGKETERFYWRPFDVPDAPPKGQQARELPWGQCEEHPEYGLTPARMTAIFREAEAGYIASQCDLLDGLREGDATLRNLYEQRRGTVSSKPRAWQPAGTTGDSELAARVLHRAMRELPMKAVLEHLLTFNEYGFAAVEIEWGLRIYEGRPWIVPTNLIVVPHRRFRVDPRTDELRLITEREPVNGERLIPGKWWVITKPGAKIARAGLGRTAAAFAMYKRWGTRDWVIYSEKFGVPLVLVKVPHNATDEMKLVARSIVANIGTDGGAVVEVPEDRTIDVEIVKAESASSQHTSGALITYCNREMGKLINGSTLTNDNADSGGASYGLGNVHADRTWENTIDDTATLQESQTAAIATPFVRWNAFAADTLAPELKIQISPDVKPAQQLANAKTMLDMGVDVSKVWLYQVSGCHAPIGADDSVLAQRAAAAATPTPGAPAAPRKPTAPGDDQAAEPKAPQAEPGATAKPDDQVDPKKPAAKASASAPEGEAKIFAYHMPFVKVNEVREISLKLPPLEGGDQIASEWAAEHAGAPEAATESKPQAED